MIKFKIIITVTFIMFVHVSNALVTNVQVENKAILVNGKPYLIKGVCYHPVPKGSNKRDFSNLDKDLALMSEAGMNTIRVYAPIDDVLVLDKINAAGFKIIMGFGYNQDGFFDIVSVALVYKIWQTF